jgi:hypothetical protein
MSSTTVTEKGEPHSRNVLRELRLDRPNLRLLKQIDATSLRSDPVPRSGAGCPRGRFYYGQLTYSFSP